MAASPSYPAEKGVERAASATLKRVLDAVLASLMLLLFAPLLLFIAAVVKLQDRGPVIHRRRVVGCSGEFDALKFRSMRVDADAWLASNRPLFHEFERDFKLRDDPRVTPFGALLRRSSADELPQLFNVLRGQMSLVGPRMITRPELAKYGRCAPKLLSVRPGLTGYWQIFGRQYAGYDERVRMDCYYIDNWSLALDLAILLRTPMRVLRGQGGS